MRAFKLVFRFLSPWKLDTNSVSQRGRYRPLGGVGDLQGGAVSNFLFEGALNTHKGGVIKMLIKNKIIIYKIHYILQFYVLSQETIVQKNI